MGAQLSVAVLVSPGRHPVSGAPRACRGDAVAMALGRALVGDALRVIYAGAEQEPSLQDYLALDAKKIEVLSVGAESHAVAALADSLKTIDLILTGLRAESGAGSGLLPYELAHALTRPVIANVLEANIATEDDGRRAVNFRQFLPKGQRRNLSCPFPMVATVHPLAPVKLTYAYSRRLSGRIEAVSGTIATKRDVAVCPAWTVETGSRRPVRLKALEKKAGHARMMSAVASETKQGIVAFEGTSVDKAQVMLNYLREHRLVDF